MIVNKIDKLYNPKSIEDKWYNTWQEKGYFKPSEKSDQEPFCIVIPPPNITGSLHMGHALNVTIQDILSRWKRMLGYSVLWLPGTDHAGIATQNVVEKQLNQENITRHQLGRDGFIKMVWKWKDTYGGRIIHQLKKIGASCDWSRERFTLDEGLSRAVREVFVKLFEEGLIYKDNRLINWCPRCHTALSDLEVDYEETDGKLYYIKYPFSDTTGYITVATTRPETILGDTGVAVNPEDTRYKMLIGKNIKLPLTNKEIPIIADMSVDTTFGTGVVKITPAHDFNDEAIAKRHNLPSISVISKDGKMTLNTGQRYEGLDRYVCRKKILEDLKSLDLFESEQRYKQRVGHCYRCKTIIEPLNTIQWYVKIDPLAKEAIKAVEDKKIRLIPEQWENNYFAWMRDIKDWCISRQIWWGHQIPVWYCPDCKTINNKTQGDFIEHTFYNHISLKDGRVVNVGMYQDFRKAGLTHDDIMKNSEIIRISKEVKPMCKIEDIKQCIDCGSSNIIRDPDVLDTWFSSALWPFSTLRWPEDSDDLKTFYPTNVLVTGFDILFFWVARMIMMGLKFKKEVPFKDVYIHALVRDIKGQKMSKSKGNVIDPLVMIEKYGADAFRFSLAAFAAQGRDIRFSEERLEGYRHFINKLWNATKFILTFKELKTDDSLDSIEGKLDIASMWILNRMNNTIEDINKNLGSYRFNDAANNIYQFIWHEFCDWYLEIVKSLLYSKDKKESYVMVNCLFFILEKSLLLLHPFMPFVTEEIWHQGLNKDQSIMISEYPIKSNQYPEAERKMQYVIDVVSGIRSIRGELNISPSYELTVFIKTFSKEVEDILKDNTIVLKKLTHSKELNIKQEIERIKGSAIYVKDEFEIYIPIEGLLDIGSEIVRLQKEKVRTEETIIFLDKKLSNEDFLKNAPQNIVEKDKTKYNEYMKKIQKITSNLKLLKTVKQEAL